MFRDISFFRRNTLLGAALAVLLVTTVELYYDFRRESSLHAEVTSTYEAITDLRALKAALEQAIAEQSAYLLTNTYAHAAGFEATLLRFKDIRRSLTQHLAGRPEQRQSLAQLDGLFAVIAVDLRRVIQRHRSEMGEAARESASKVEPPAEVRECRLVLQKIEQTEREQLPARSAQAAAQESRTHWALGLGNASLLLLLVVAGSAIERDLRERERGRQAVLASEARLRLALDAANAGTWEWDLNTNENVWSSELWKLFGLQPFSRPPSYEAWKEVVHPEDRTRAEKVVTEASRTGSELNVEFRVAGTPRWLLSRARLHESGDRRERRYIGIAVDITERKLAEEALRERERTLYRFIEFAPVAIAMFDCEMRYLAASSRYRTDFKLGSQPLTGRSHYEIFPEIPQEWKEIHQRCIRGELRRNPGEPFVRSDGAVQWIRWEIQPWRQPAGSVGGIVLFTEDITRQVVSQQTLRESEARLRLAQQVAKVGTFEWNIQTGVNTWTPELEAIYGLQPGEFTGAQSAWESFLHPEDRADALRLVEEAMTMGGWEADFRIIRPTGEIRCLSGRAFVFLDAAGDPLRMIGVNIDNTDRHAAEAIKRRWQRSFEQAELAIALSDVASGTLIAVNESFARERGYTVPELTERSLGSLFPPHALPTLSKLIAAADLGGHTVMESEHLRKDGTSFPVRIDLTVIRNERGRAESRVAFVQDLTAQRQAEQQVHQLTSELETRVRERTAQLEAANRELEAFAYSVSHDLRAPLRGIDGWSLALLEDYGERLNEQALKYLNRVRSEAQRMGILIDDLLQLSRIARTPMVPVDVDLSSIAHAVAVRLQDAQPTRRLEFLITPGLMAAGDPRLLEVALTNLLGNAVKFTAPREPARIELAETESSTERVFYVRDNGVGFDMSLASTLFGAFQRLHKSSEFPGTGIGLATVQRIIHRHGGRIWGEAQVGRGATFYFTLNALST